MAAVSSRVGELAHRSESKRDDSRDVFIRVRAGDTLTHLARRFGVSVDALTNANSLQDPDRLTIAQRLRVPPPASGAPLTVTVQPGDTLSAIAWRLGVTVDSLAKANSIANSNSIRSGQALQLRAAKAAPTAAESQPVGKAPCTPATDCNQHWQTAAGAAAGGAVVASEAWAPNGLRLAAAALGTVENITRLRNTPMVLVQRRIFGAAGATVAAARMVGDAKNLREDIEREGIGVNAAESALKLTRNEVRFVRGMEQVAISFMPRLKAHMLPSLNRASAVLDVGIAAAIHANPDASRLERGLADAAAASSSIGALNIRVVSQLFGIAATALGLWRDELGDERRARESEAATAAKAAPGWARKVSG